MWGIGGTHSDGDTVRSAQHPGTHTYKGGDNCARVGAGAGVVPGA